MTTFGAPGNGPSRRDFLKATGAGGLAATAGCTAPSGSDRAVRTTQQEAMQSDESLPTTSPPQVVNVDEQGGQVTMRTQPATHAVHPTEVMGGPVEFPRVWAFQADDREPSVPGPILRTTEGEDMEVTLDNAESQHPHTLHFHGARKTWENDGVPSTTGITVGASEKHTYEIPANVPGTHIYPMHCHKVNHVMNGRSYPGGMLSAVVYESVMDSDIFAGLMEYAGYEG